MAISIIRALICATGVAAVIVACGGSTTASGRSDNVSALEHEVSQLETQAARLEDVRNIERLQRAYGYYLDAAQWDEIADLFADDGSIEIGLDGLYKGRERVRQYLHALGHGRVGLAYGELNTHMILQPVIDLAPDGRTAKGRWRAVIMTGVYGKSADWGEGPYENDYVKQNGVWKIERLHWYQTYMVPYRGGWAKNKDVNRGIYVSKQLPPDAPPTEQYETWPSVYIPPFHYRKTPAPSVDTGAAEAAPDGAEADHNPMAAGAGGDPAIAELQTNAAELGRRIGRLEDVNAVERLVGVYGYYLDKQQWNDLANIFATNGTMEISLRGVYVGRPSIRRALELFGPQNIEPAHLHNHIQLQPVIHVSADGTRAWSRSRALSELGTYPRIGMWGDGVYENEYVKVNGVWQIAKDHVYTTFFATYDQGWQNGAGGAPRASEKIPPDRPPTELYDAYPGEYVAPFDYAHPVTGAPIVVPSELRVRANTDAAAIPAEGSAAAAAGTAVPLSAPSAAPSTSPEADKSDAELLAPVRARLMQIAQSVERLEDERAIVNLQRSYGYFVDKAMWKETADLFADDATLEIGGRGVFVGKPRVLQYITWLAPRGLTRGKIQNHIQLQPIITVAPDGRTAKGRWRWLAEVGDYKKDSRWGIGTYENEYVKEGGVWKIKTLHGYFRMYTDYADGWAKSAVPNTHPEKDLPPDRPPTVLYQTYPATFIPPYDYPNPVTGK
ncbi:MAG TPA: nuclear transport factor 2 family protein [Steroidobacteraceae bacterium]